MRFLLAEMDAIPLPGGGVRYVPNVILPDGAGYAMAEVDGIGLIATTGERGTASVSVTVGDPEVVYRTAQGHILLREHDGGAALREAFGGFPAVG